MSGIKFFPAGSQVQDAEIRPTSQLRRQRCGSRQYFFSPLRPLDPVSEIAHIALFSFSKGFSLRNHLKIFSLPLIFVNWKTFQTRY